jgi:hypothetical protein
MGKIHSPNIFFKMKAPKRPGTAQKGLDVMRATGMVEEKVDESKVDCII